MDHLMFRINVYLRNLKQLGRVPAIDMNPMIRQLGGVKILRSTLLLLVTSLLLSGCTGNWLVGKWDFDKERTLNALEVPAPESPNAAPGGGGLLKNIVGGLQKGLSKVMLTQFDGVQFEFTADEIRRVRNGIGDAQGYEIIEKPTPDTYLVKTDDGTIVTWEKVESGIRLKLASDNDGWVYFRAGD